MDAELEQRVIKKASELFLMHGIKSITMDYIAHEIGMSKRTLYELFRDKDTLLLKTLEYQEKKNLEERMELEKHYSNPLELGLAEYERISRSLQNVNRNYIRDLQRYHPKVATFLEKDRKANMERMIQTMEEGQKGGYIRRELNSRILALLLQVQLELLLSSDEIEKNHFSFTEVFDTIVMNQIRGIATAKGLELVEKYMKNK